MNATAKQPLVYLFWAPATFVDDHLERSPCDGDPDVEIVVPIRRTGARVMICGDANQVENLRADAAFYCDRAGPDACPPNVKRSAAAVLAAIAKAKEKA